MIATFVYSVALMIGAANMGFEQGQANPQASSLLTSVSTVFVDDRSYGVDDVK